MGSWFNVLFTSIYVGQIKSRRSLLTKRRSYSPHVRESGFGNPGKSGILGFGIRNTGQGIRNPTKDWNPEFKFYWQILESSTWNPESTACNPESRFK